jgi:chorismate mutase
MSNKEIRELLARLQDEIQQTELDDETLSLVRDLDSDIDDLLDPDGTRAQTESVVEKARALETNFATEHPAIERFMREVIDALVRMGI